MIAPSRWLPHPLLSLVLTVVWLLLVNSVELAQILFGLLLGLLVPLLTRGFWPDSQPVYKLWRFVRFGFLVLGDIVIANIHVAFLILGSNAKLRPAFIHLPLDLKNEFAITLLASTISLTPGTVSSDVSPDRRYLLVHSLDVEDEAELIATIKQRYEAPLKEIFECSP